MNAINQTTLKIPLIISSFLIVVSVRVVYTTPAAGYELSIYSSTPVFFWISMFLIIALCSFYTIVLSKYYRTSILLGSIAVTTIVSLPLIRNYYHIGAHDALTHSGYVTGITEGTVNPFDLFYPASHVYTLIIKYLLGIEVGRGLILVCVIFILLFFISIPATVRVLFSDSQAVSVAALSGFMLAPLGRLGIRFAPNQFGRLFIGFLLFLLVIIFINRGKRYVFLLFISLLFLLVLHPQMSVSFLLALSGMGVLTCGIAFYKRSDLHRTFGKLLFVIITSYGLLTYSWIESKDVFVGQIGGFVLSIYTPSPGGDTVTMADSLLNVGGSIPVIFVKLFLQPLIYILFTLVLVAILANMFRKRECSVNRTNIQSLLIILFFGLIPIAGLFLVAFVTDETFMRYLYFSLATVTLLGSLGLYTISVKLEKDFIIFVLVLLLLCLGILIYYPSPYIYSANSQVTESQISGYDTAFEYGSDELNYAHVRSNAWRFAHETEGVSIVSRYDDKYSTGMPDHFAKDGLDDPPRYITVTETDRQRETIAFQELRYRTDEFQYLEENKQIQKVISTGEFDLYINNS